MKKTLLLCLLITVYWSLCSTAHARTEGFFLGAGYQQPIMYTWKSQGLGWADAGSSMKFFPSFGAFLMPGYDFAKPDWFSIAAPLGWSMVRINSTGWFQMIGGDVEAMFHLANPDSKFDPYIGAFAGFNYMTKGNVLFKTHMVPDVGASFGFRYTLSESAVAGSPHVTNLSLFAEVPVKIMFILNDNDLSDDSMTPILNFPVRFGLTYTF